MKNRTTSLNFISVLLGMAVLFFVTVLKLDVGSSLIFVADASSFEDNELQECFSQVLSAGSFHEDMQKDDSVEFIQESSMISEFKTPTFYSLFLVDFDDLEYTFTALSVLPTRVFFFKEGVQSYNSIVYRKVKLFLFYSVIKIPSTFL